MALDTGNNEINWFDTLSGLTTNDTPFVNWYMPDDNEPHVTLTNANVAFALTEIIQETLTVNDLSSGSISLERNPIGDQLVILSSNSFENTKISIIDLTGKIVYDDFQALTERTVVPVHLASGLYVLSIEANNKLMFQSKLIAK
jgi:hypothetical protein